MKTPPTPTRTFFGGIALRPPHRGPNAQPLRRPRGPQCHDVARLPHGATLRCCDTFVPGRGVRTRCEVVPARRRRW